MKKNIGLSFVFILFGVLLLTSCMGQKKDSSGEDSEHPVFEQGIIINKSEDGHRWLITQYSEDNDAPSVRAISFTVASDTVLESNDGEKLSVDDFHIGQQVKAWATGAIAESYPEQAKAGKIVLASDDQGHPTATITKAMAIQSALEAAKPSMAGAIKSVNQVEGTAFWKVEIVDGGHLGRIDTFHINMNSGDVSREPVAENEAFRIFAPAPQEEVASPFLVSGEARVFEAMFHWSVEDGHNILAEGHMMADQGAPEWGAFEFEVNFNHVTSPTLSLVFYVLSAKDGSVEQQLIIPLKVPIKMIERPS